MLSADAHESLVVIPLRLGCLRTSSEGFHVVASTEEEEVAVGFLAAAALLLLMIAVVVRTVEIVVETNWVAPWT
jgi:hypothetical protein